MIHSYCTAPSVTSSYLLTLSSFLLLLRHLFLFLKKTQKFQSLFLLFFFRSSFFLFSFIYLFFIPLYHPSPITPLTTLQHTHRLDASTQLR
ncbi:hypothetical protein QR685DRAFT_513318 [Neurospora intermedia]|uniref:Uncharacterized protein n=1 Tax=Neurospora intermedia TaxID=5142 RepID=A0ABR3DTG2_NEUIN